MCGKAWAIILIFGAVVPSTVTAVNGEPVVGVEAGGALPTSTSRRSAGAGGAIGVFAGYRLNLFDNSFAITLLGEPLYAAFPTGSCGAADERPCQPSGEGDVTGLFGLTFGPRFSLVDGPIELYFTAKGGYYTTVSGSIRGSGGGFNFGGGLSYALAPAATLGAFVRFEEAAIDAATNSTDNFTFVFTGLTFEYRFLESPPVVAEAPPPPPPAPAPPPVKQKIVLRGVQFDFNKSDIRPDARPILDEAIATLKQHPGITIAVEGFTDDIGTPAYNQALSVRRARAVEAYLAAGGIAANRMTVEGFGESRPVASNATADGRAQNRRVELRIVSGD
jgi:outer membrane protein OmpA-like peptidoglycan-associated protein